MTKYVFCDDNFGSLDKALVGLGQRIYKGKRGIFFKESVKAVKLSAIDENFFSNNDDLNTLIFVGHGTAQTMGKLSDQQFVEKVCQIIPEDRRSSVEHVYLVSCDVGLRDREGDAFAQRVVNLLFQQGFSSSQLRVHALSECNSEQNKSGIVSLLGSDGLLDYSVSDQTVFSPCFSTKIENGCMLIENPLVTLHYRVNPKTILDDAINTFSPNTVLKRVTAPHFDNQTILEHALYTAIDSLNVEREAKYNYIWKVWKEKHHNLAKCPPLPEIYQFTFDQAKKIFDSLSGIAHNDGESIKKRGMAAQEIRDLTLIATHTRDCLPTGFPTDLNEKPCNALKKSDSQSWAAYSAAADRVGKLGVPHWELKRSCSSFFLIIMVALLATALVFLLPPLTISIGAFIGLYAGLGLNLLSLLPKLQCLYGNKDQKNHSELCDSVKKMRNRFFYRQPKPSNDKVTIHNSLGGCYLVKC